MKKQRETENSKKIIFTNSRGMILIHFYEDVCTYTFFYYYIFIFLFSLSVLLRSVVGWWYYSRWVDSELIYEQKNVCTESFLMEQVFRGREENLSCDIWSKTNLPLAFPGIFSATSCSKFHKNSTQTRI